MIREGLGDVARELSREFMVDYRKSGLTVVPSLYLAVIYMANPRTPGAPRVGGYAEICYFFRIFFTGNANGKLNAKVDFLAAAKIPIITYTVQAGKSSHLQIVSR